MKKIAWVLCVVLLLMGWLTALAQQADIIIEDVTQRQGESFVSYPQLSGMPNTFVQDSINRAIVADGGIPGYLAALPAMTDPAATGLTVQSQAQVLPTSTGGLLAVRLDAQGRIGPGRPGHAVVPLMYSLTTGQRVTAADLFADPAMAAVELEAMIARDIEPDVSAYLSADALYPLPMDRLLVDETGITFYYDQAQYTTLSGRSGAVHFLYHELRPLLRMGEGSLLGDILQSMPRAPLAEAAEAIGRAVHAGRLPGLMVALGDSLEEALAAHPLLMDPEAFPAGEKYQPEDAHWRGSVLIASAGQVTGIMSHRMNLYGLITGEATQSLVEQALGQPTASLPLDEQAAVSYNMIPGKLDRYDMQGRILSFNYDSSGTLQTIWLSVAD